MPNNGAKIYQERILLSTEGHGVACAVSDPQQMPLKITSFCSGKKLELEEHTVIG